MTERAADLATLLAERAITRTLYDYAAFLDYGGEEDWLGCFTPEATWTLHDPVHGRTFSGHEELRGFFRWHSHAPDKYHKHLTANIRVTADIAAGTARAQSYFVRLDRLDGPVAHSFGRYLDELRCDVDGRWRFTSRDVELEARLPPR